MLSSNFIAQSASGSSKCSSLNKDVPYFGVSGEGKGYLTNSTDLIAVSIVSLISYYWAAHTALPVVDLDDEDEVESTDYLQVENATISK